MPQAHKPASAKRAKRSTPFPQQVENKERQRKIAWAHYYEERRHNFDYQLSIVQMAQALKDATTISQSSSTETKLCIPSHVLLGYLEMAKACQKDITCPVCLE